MCISKWFCSSWPYPRGNYRGFSENSEAKTGFQYSFIGAILLYNFTIKLSLENRPIAPTDRKLRVFLCYPFQWNYGVPARRDLSVDKTCQTERIHAEDERIPFRKVRHILAESVLHLCLQLAQPPVSCSLATNVSEYSLLWASG